MTPIYLLCLLMAIPTDEPATSRFSDVQIQGPFKQAILGDPLLLEMTGARVVETTNGQRMVISVASTVLESDSPQERLRTERVCRVKALAALVARDNPVRVLSMERVADRTVITVENGREQARNVSEVVEMIRTEVAGARRDLPVVGWWKSLDGKVFYLAIGETIDAASKPASVVTSSNKRWIRTAQRRADSPR